MSSKICPFCRQEIDEKETKCPFCTTTLAKKDYSKLLVTLSMIFYLFWVLENTLCFKLFGVFPEILRMKDKDGCLIFSLAEYISFCIQPVIAVMIPLIITIIKKVRIREAIIGLCVCVVTVMILIPCFIHLQKWAGIS